MGVPNACNQCPVERSNQWSIDALERRVASLLRDPVRGVRLAAASVLADVRPADVADPEFRTALEHAFAEYLNGSLANNKHYLAIEQLSA
jgi:hypothetical protein